MKQTPRQIKQPPTPKEQEKSPTHLTASQIFFIIGVALVITATVVIIAYSWPTLSPLMRFLAIAIPNAILFLISLFVKGLVYVKKGAHATALLMLPFSIGVFLYQFNIIFEIDYFLFFWSSLMALPIYLYNDLVKKLNYAAVFVLIDAIAVLLFFFNYLKLDFKTVSGLLLIGATIGFFIAWNSKIKNDKNHYESYASVSALFFSFCIPAFISNLFTSSLLTISLVGSLALFIVAYLFGKLLIPWTRIEYQLQRFILIFFLFMLFTPLVLLAADKTIYSLLIIGLSLAIITIGILLGINLIFIGGVIAFIIGLLIPLLKSVGNISAPILLFIGGFIAIGLSILIGKSKIAKKTFYSEAIAQKFCMISDATGKKLTIKK